MYTHKWISSLCAKHTVFYVLPTHILEYGGQILLLSAWYPVSYL